MRSRGFAWRSVLPVLALAATVVLGACAPIPGLPAPAPTEPVTVETAPAMRTLVAGSTATAGPDSPVPSVTAAATPAAGAVVTATLAVSPTVSSTPGTFAPVVEPAATITSTPSASMQSGNAPAPEAVLTYRDDVGGFEIDYPASWSLVDVTPQIKQESLGYSVTLSSWKPQEPGGQGIPEGGSKVDVGVTKGGAATPDAAAELRRGEITAADPGSQIVFEEPWDLPGGLTATHWTIQPANGDAIEELVTAIDGNLIIVSGYGDLALFEQTASTLRPAGVPGTASNQVLVPMVTGSGAAANAPNAGTPGAGADSAALATPNAASAKALAASTYTVRAGDTLAKIAARFGVTVSAILAANPQVTNPDRIYIGQRLVIPSAGGVQPPPPAGTTRVNIYMIGEGGGSVGCGDQVVAVRRDVPRTAAPLTAALNLLLSQKSQYYGESGLYNALYQSNLRIASITRKGSAWTINLAGTFQLGGVCDNPRVKAQLDQTALQFSTVQSVRYFINGKPLESLLSGK